ncbi:MAG: PqqD family protein, partial [Acidobacteria bacterium]|nr:PqqD family protein [Acidobacteriota bacterium]
NSMSLTSRPRRHPDAVYKIVDGEALIVVPGSEAQHLVLNKVGAWAWELLDGDHDLESICEQLTIEFDVELDEAGRDLNALLADLQEHGALDNTAN